MKFTIYEKVPSTFIQHYNGIESWKEVGELRDKQEAINRAIDLSNLNKYTEYKVTDFDNGKEIFKIKQ